MTSKERATKFFEEFKALYGEEIARHMLYSILYCEVLYHDLPKEESDAIFAELIK